MAVLSLRWRVHSQLRQTSPEGPAWQRPIKPLSARAKQSSCSVSGAWNAWNARNFRFGSGGHVRSCFRNGRSLRDLRLQPKPLPRAYRPFIGTIRKVGKGSTADAIRQAVSQNMRDNNHIRVPSFILSGARNPPPCRMKVGTASRKRDAPPGAYTFYPAPLLPPPPRLPELEFSGFGQERDSSTFPFQYVTVAAM